MLDLTAAVVVQVPSPWVRVGMVEETHSEDIEVWAMVEKAVAEKAMALTRWLVHACELGKPSVIISLTGGSCAHVQMDTQSRTLSRRPRFVLL